MSKFRDNLKSVIESVENEEFLGNFTEHPLWNDYVEYLTAFSRNNAYHTSEGYHNTIGPLSFESYVARRKDNLPISTYETEMAY